MHGRIGLKVVEENAQAESQCSQCCTVGDAGADLAGPSLNLIKLRMLDCALCSDQGLSTLLVESNEARSDYRVVEVLTPLKSLIAAWGAVEAWEHQLCHRRRGPCSAFATL